MDKGFRSEIDCINIKIMKVQHNRLQSECMNLLSVTKAKKGPSASKSVFRENMARPMQAYCQGKEKSTIQ